MELREFLSKHPVVPYVRESDFGVRKPWVVARRRLLDYLLFYVQEGRCIVEHNGQKHAFHKGEWCFVQPRKTISSRGLTETITPFAHFDIFFHARREESFPAPPGLMDLTPHEHLVQPRLDAFGLQIPLRLQPQNASWLRETFLRAVGAWQNRDTLSQLEAQTLMTEIVLAIWRDHSDASTHIAQSPQNLNWITSYLQLHLAEPITVADMARRARLSPSRFAAAFRQNFGCAPHQYLLHLRIAHAQELLSGEISTEEVARLTGFGDVHHFSKAFKSRTGQTPGQWKKQRV
jgi:AraC-like DNA-binding protein